METAADEGCQHIFGRWGAQEEAVSHTAGSVGEVEGLMSAEVPGKKVRSRPSCREEGPGLPTGEQVEPVRGAQTPRAVESPQLAQPCRSPETPTGEFGSAHETLRKVGMKYRTENTGAKWKSRY